MERLLEFLDELEVNLHRGVHEEVLKKKFKKELPILIRRCAHTNQFIARSQAGTWHITEDGVKYLDRLRYRDMQKNHLVLSNNLTLVTILLAVVTLVYPLVLIFDGMFRYQIIDESKFTPLFIGFFIVFLILIMGALLISWMEEKRIHRL